MPFMVYMPTTGAERVKLGWYVLCILSNGVKVNFDTLTSLQWIHKKLLPLTVTSCC